MDPGFRFSGGLYVLAAMIGCALTPREGAAQQIYKWTDSQGQVHYSDRANDGQATETVKVSKAPPKPVPVATQVVAVSEPRYEPVHPGSSVLSPVGPEARRNVQAWAHNAQTAAQQSTDKALVAKCNANRESYCNDISEIKAQQAISNAPQPGRMTDCHPIPGMGVDCRYIPPPKADPPPPMPTWNNMWGRSPALAAKKPKKSSDGD